MNSTWSKLELSKSKNVSFSILTISLLSKLGVKSGEGFYDYSEGPKNKKVAAQFAK